MYRPRARDQPVHSCDHGVHVVVHVDLNPAASEGLATVPIERDFRRDHVRDTGEEGREFLLGRCIRQITDEHLTVAGASCLG